MPAVGAGGNPAVRFQNVEHAYGGQPAVRGVSFEVARGEFVVLLGPSGCGKTTLLKMVNRLIEPTGGRVFVDGVDTMAVDAVALRRRIGYAIQQVGLFPHMTVEQNVAVVPGLLAWPPDRVHARVAELLALVHLDPAGFARRYPRQLSGGQQQRVGLARALAGDPQLLLMDEPFGAVDAIERAHLQAELAALHRRLGTSVLFVTHDVDEALRLADRIVVMRDGRVEQAATPFAILTRPANPFVAELVESDDVLRRLSVLTLDDVEAALPGDAVTQQPSMEGSTPLRLALSHMLGAGADAVAVEREGTVTKVVSLQSILQAVRGTRGSAS